MKIDVNCEHFKPTNKNGIKDRCHCAFLNRNFHRETKLYLQGVKLNEFYRQEALKAKKNRKKTK